MNTKRPPSVAEIRFDVIVRRCKAAHPVLWDSINQGVAGACVAASVDVDALCDPAVDRLIVEIIDEILIARRIDAYGKNE